MPTDRKALVWGIPGTLLGFIWSLPPLFLCLALLMGMDMLSGAIGAGIRGEIIKPSKLWKGLLKKFHALLVVAALKLLCIGIGMEADFAAVAAGALCLTEALSILKNAGRAGVPVPAYVIRVLVAMNDEAQAGPKPKGTQ